MNENKKEESADSVETKKTSATPIGTVAHPKVEMPDSLNPILNPMPNPMEESEYPYSQTFGKVLQGLAKALVLRQGRLIDVQKEDILDYADVNPKEFEFLFSDSFSIVERAEQEIISIFIDADRMLSDMSVGMQLQSVLGRLRKNSPILTVFRLTGNHHIWRLAMRDFIKRIAKGWPVSDSTCWEYLFNNFCCQFAIILEKWEESDFSKDKIVTCSTLIESWLEVDAMIGEANGELLISWEEKS